LLHFPAWFSRKMKLSWHRSRMSLQDSLIHWMTYNFFILIIDLNSTRIFRMFINISVLKRNKFIGLDLLRFWSNFIFIRMLKIFLLKMNFFLLSIWIYSHLIFFWSGNKVDIFDRCSKVILIIEIVCTFLSVYGLSMNIGLKLFINWLTLIILICMIMTVFLKVLILELMNIYVCIFLWGLKLNLRLFF
jgi:hypothetical protein